MRLACGRNSSGDHSVTDLARRQVFLDHSFFDQVANLSLAAELSLAVSTAPVSFSYLSNCLEFLAMDL